MGYSRVPTVTEVAEFSVRGGILDLYGFGMAGPARLEWWGDDISSIRGFDLTTQRSLQELTEVTVLPIDTRGVREPEVEAGVGLSEASAAGPESRPLGRPPARGHRWITGRAGRAPDAARAAPVRHILLEEAAGPDQDEVQRAWNEAEHHLEVARRLGEDVPGREEILEPPEQWRSRVSAYPRLLLRDERVDLQFGFFRPRRSTAI